jgi:hypothetical protein
MCPRKSCNSFFEFVILFDHMIYHVYQLFLCQVPMFQPEIVTLTRYECQLDKPKCLYHGA